MFNQQSYGLLPALLFSLIARAEFGPDAALMAGATLLGVAVLTGAAALAGRLPVVAPSARAPMIAVAALFNVVLFLVLVGRLLGEDSALTATPVAVAGVIAGTAVSVSVFALDARVGAVSAARKVVTDPVVLSSLAGLLANSIGLARHADFLLQPFAIAGAGSAAVILLSLGAGLDFTKLHGRIGALAIGAALRSVIGAAVFLGLARLFGLEGDGAVILALAGAAPGAAFSYAIAADFEADTGFMAGLLTLSVLVSTGVSVLAAALALAL